MSSGVEKRPSGIVARNAFFAASVSVPPAWGVSGIAGAVLTSGFYDLGKEISVWKVYYGDDVATYAERSSLPGLVMTSVQLFVTDAELVPPKLFV